MGQDVDANGRSILHKGHGMTHTCAVPDVCKTPTPGGPVPIPYVNIAMDSDITDGAETVKIEGNPVANVGAKISTSTGDEAGSAGGGIISSKIKGTVTWKMGSLDVKAEGKSVVRFLDQDFHNGNSFNTAFISPGKTGMAYGDDFKGKCPVCNQKPDNHAILETVNSARICSKIIEGLKNRFNALEWDEKYLVAKKRGARINGYMVGVMVCKHPNGSKPRVFAAMSGYKKVPEFEQIAMDTGLVDKVILPSSGGVTKGDLKAANRSGTVAKQPQMAQKLDDEMDKRWKKIEDRPGRDGYSQLGTCAAQYLIAKSDHAPSQMTEMFFSPPGTEPWPGRYRFRVDGKLRQGKSKPWFGPAVKKTPKTPWGPTVASCHTCQELLPLTLCPKRQCK